LNKIVNCDSIFYPICLPLLYKQWSVSSHFPPLRAPTSGHFLLLHFDFAQVPLPTKEYNKK